MDTPSLLARIDPQAGAPPPFLPADGAPVWNPAWWASWHAFSDARRGLPPHGRHLAAYLATQRAALAAGSPPLFTMARNPFILAIYDDFSRDEVKALYADFLARHAETLAGPPFEFVDPDARGELIRLHLKLAANCDRDLFGEEVLEQARTHDAAERLLHDPTATGEPRSSKYLWLENGVFADGEPRYDRGFLVGLLFRDFAWFNQFGVRTSLANLATSALEELHLDWEAREVSGAPFVGVTLPTLRTLGVTMRSQAPDLPAVPALGEFAPNLRTLLLHCAERPAAARESIAGARLRNIHGAPNMGAVLRSQAGTIPSQSGGLMHPRRPFVDLAAAQQWVDRFVRWYNTEHLHRAIRFVTPDARHFGQTPDFAADLTTPLRILADRWTAAQSCRPLPSQRMLVDNPGMRLLAALGLTLTACNTTDTTDTGLTGSPTAPTSVSGTGTGTGTSGEATATDTASPTGGLSDSTAADVSTGAPPTTGDGPKLDLMIPDAGTGTDDGCTKIDFLFVVDNSNSMAAEQALLTAALPGFITAIQAALPDTSDYQIGVTKTDIFGFDPDPDPDPQNPCPYALGGLLSHATPDGEKTGTGPGCNFASGKNFMTAGPSLAQEFSCAASVGVKGNTGETQAAALLAAVGPELAAPGACNEGFLRPDALLVVIMITDEDDDWSPPKADKQQNAAAWSTALIAAKNDLPENLAFVLISGGDPRWPDCKDISPNDFTGAAASPNLSALATSIPSHSLGNICQAGYEDTLAAAIASISTACESFTPPG